MIRSCPSLFLLCFVLTGIVGADRLDLSPYPCLLLALVIFGTAVMTRRRGWGASASLLVGLSLGLVSAFSFSLRYNQPGPNHLKRLITEPTLCHVYGQVADWPELKPARTEIVIAVDSLRSDGATGSVTRAVEGSLLLKVADTTTALQRGDRVTFYTRLYPLQERETSGFDYGRFLKLKSIFAQAYLTTLLHVQIDDRPGIGYLVVVDKVRSAIRSTLDHFLSVDASALARGFLIGETRDIPPHIYEMFRDSGTLHLLAVSGSNVALVILFFIWVMRPFWFGPLTRAVILLAIVAIFAGISYGDPSVMRASIMATLVIGARLLHRSYNLNNIVAVTALIILLVEPAQLFDVGFQLSFVTAWGLVFLVPHLTDLFRQYHDRLWYRWLVFPALIALVAQLCSTPIIAYYFGRIPVISVAANLIIVPAVSLAVFGILLLLVADLVWPLLGAFVGSLLDLWLQGVVRVLAVMGGDNTPVLQTGSLFKGGVGLLAMVAAYAIFILIVLSFRYRFARRLAVSAVILVTNIGLACAVFGQSERDRAWVECTSVPGGVAVLIRDAADDRPDLIITGLVRRSYPIDERVLSPWLVRQGVQRLGRVFVLSAEYTALDDLLRALSDYEARWLYAGRYLAPRLADVLAAMGDTAPRLEVVYFDGARSVQELSGYYLSDHQISLNLGQSRVDLVDKLPAGHFEPDDGRMSATLVIGSTWEPVADDWIQLRQSGYEQIICAKFEQQTTAPWPDSELDPDSEPPDYICDLSRTGSARFKLVF